VLKVANLRFTWHELQVFGNVLVRLLVQMAVVPGLVTENIVFIKERQPYKSSRSAFQFLNWA
jgi:hypothetical protein